MSDTSPPTPSEHSVETALSYEGKARKDKPRSVQPLIPAEVFYKVFPTSSILQKHEAEVIARNIMVIRSVLGKWDLSFSDYKKYRLADGGYGHSEKGYFEQVYPLIETVEKARAFSKNWDTAAREYLQVTKLSPVEYEARNSELSAELAELKREADTVFPTHYDMTNSMLEDLIAVYRHHLDPDPEEDS